ncbi:MAG: methyltransferase domain-containing protein [Clostridia bacterium]
MKELLCPVCKEELERSGKTYVCKNKHLFDIAKEGYANLLLSDAKNSKNPGDNTLMVNARKDFLNKDYYKQLALAISGIIDEKFNFSATLLDAGVGVGYYIKTIETARAERNITDNVFGVDISKCAVKCAAKSNPKATIAVASVYNLPFASDSFDVVLCVFSPFAVAEYLRVLKKGGYLIVVTPSENHLIEMRKLLYAENTRTVETSLPTEGLDILKKVELSFPLALASTQDIAQLIEMTPYIYRAPKTAVDNLLSLDKLDATADFNLTVITK